MTSEKPEARKDGGKPRPLWRRLLKIAIWLLAIFVALCIVIAILVPIILTEERLKSIIADVGGEALNGRKVSVGSADLDLWSGIKLTDLRVGGREGWGSDLMRVKEADVRVQVWSAVTSFGKTVHAKVIVTDPHVVVERTADGRLSIEDLLELTKEEEEPLVLDDVSLEFKLTGGEVVFREQVGGGWRETKLGELNVRADLASIDKPLTYEMTGSVGDGRIQARGSVHVFHEGTVDPARIRGKLLTATVSGLKADAIPAGLGLAEFVKAVDAELTVRADTPGQVISSGKLTVASPHEGVGLTATLTSEADLAKLDVFAKVCVNAAPFSESTLDVEVRDAGADKIDITGDFKLDLAKLTGSKLAGALGMPALADGTPAASKGVAAGQLEIGGKLTEMTCSVSGSIEGFQAHPSLTGGTELPPEDADFKADIVLTMTSDGKPETLEIPSLEARAAFLEAKITDGRLTSLADLKQLDADLSGYAKFSGRAFSSKLGKALGLPPVHDKVAATFSAKGNAGEATVQAAAKLEREEGPAEPIAFDLSAKIDASGEQAKLTEIRGSARAGADADPYLQGALTGSVGDLTGDPSIDLAFGGRIDVRRLAARVAAYADILSELKPAGLIVVRDGKLRGTPSAFQAEFKAAATKLSLAGGSDDSRVPKELTDLLSKEEFLCLAKLKADLTQNRIEIEAFNVKSEMLTAGISGVVSDYAALEAAVDVSVVAKTDAIGPALAALQLAPKGIDTTGRAEFAARLDTGAGRVELKKLQAATPYIDVSLKEPGVITGIDVAKLQEDPVAAATSIAGSAEIEGVVRLGALAKLPAGVLPEGLKADGDVPFSVTLGKASPTKAEFSADATGAALSYGDLFAKPAGGKAVVSVIALLPEDAALDIQNLEAEVDGAQLNLAGTLSEDLGTFTCKSFRATLDEPEKLIAMAPALKDIALAGKADLTGSATVDVEKAKTGDLSGVVLDGTANVRDLRARYKPIPKIEVRAGGAVKLGSKAIDASGLTVTARQLEAGHDATLTFKQLRVTSAKPNAPLLSDLDALALTFAAHSAEIDAGALLAALPEKEDAAGDAGEPAPPSDEPAAEEPLDFAFLKKHRVDGTVAVDKLVYEKHVVSNIAADFELRDNKLVTRKPVRAQVHKGTVEMNATADLNDPKIAHSGSVSIKKIDIDSAVGAMLPYEAVFQGKLGGGVTWKGQGLAMADIKRAWTGDGEMLIEDGVIANFEKSPEWVAAISGFLTEQLGGKVFPGDKYRYGEVRIKGHLAEGKLKAEPFTLKSKVGLNFEVSDLLGDLDGNADALTTVLIPTDRAMEFIADKISAAKRPRVAALIKEKLLKDDPPFGSLHHVWQDGKYRFMPKLLIIDWVTKAAGNLLSDPRGLLDGLLKDKLEEKKRDREKRGKDEEDDPKKEAIKGILDGLFK